MINCFLQVCIKVFTRRFKSFLIDRRITKSDYIPSEKKKLKAIIFNYFIVSVTCIVFIRMSN